MPPKLQVGDVHHLNTACPHSRSKHKLFFWQLRQLSPTFHPVTSVTGVSRACTRIVVSSGNDAIGWAAARRLEIAPVAHWPGGAGGGRRRGLAVSGLGAPGAAPAAKFSALVVTHAAEGTARSSMCATEATAPCQRRLAGPLLGAQFLRRGGILRPAAPGRCSCESNQIWLPEGLTS